MVQVALGSNAHGCPPSSRPPRPIRRHAHGIAAAVTRGLANWRHEGLNDRARKMTKRSYGFHTRSRPASDQCSPVG